MALSEQYESTIVEVRAYFGFDNFDCDPDVITEALGLQPSEGRRKGCKRTLQSGREITNVISSWTIESISESKDINVHLRELLGRLQGIQGKIHKRFGTPSFSVLWKGNYLFAGSGPFYEVDVLQGIAALGAMLWHDIYQVDEDNEEC